MLSILISFIRFIERIVARAPPSQRSIAITHEYYSIYHITMCVIVAYLHLKMLTQHFLCLSSSDNASAAPPRRRTHSAHFQIVDEHFKILAVIIIIKMRSC